MKLACAQEKKYYLRKIRHWILWKGEEETGKCAHLKTTVTDLWTKQVWDKDSECFLPLLLSLSSLPIPSASLHVDLKGKITLLSSDSEDNLERAEYGSYNRPILNIDFFSWINATRVNLCICRRMHWRGAHWGDSEWEVWKEPRESFQPSHRAPGRCWAGSAIWAELHRPSAAWGTPWFLFVTTCAQVLEPSAHRGHWNSLGRTPAQGHCTMAKLTGLCSLHPGFCTTHQMPMESLHCGTELWKSWIW